ncbi:MAG: BtpA/SgcQ family protein [bacterium]|nr:BtpA/SgcQ family protein [bacterium]
MQAFNDLFNTAKPLIACIHLLPLPGAPRYSGSMQQVYETALVEADIFSRYPIDGLIIENFRDVPFYPNQLPAETIAAMATVTREVVKAVCMPVGVNALRHDAAAAMAIATAAQARFIRVNVHMHTVVSDQGILQGMSHATLRLRTALRANILIMADVGVKHATPLGARALAIESHDVTERGMADAIIVSGDFTGSPTQPADVEMVRQHTALPILVGSGVTPDNLSHIYAKTDGMIVGSFFKQDGQADNLVEEHRVKTFTDAVQSLRNQHDTDLRAEA